MRTWPIALLVLLVAAAPARAGRTLMPDSESIVVAGPMFADERLVWATRSTAPDGYDVHVAAPDGTGHTIHTVEAPVAQASHLSFAFDASARRTALSVQVFRYYNRKDPGGEILYSRISSGPLGTVPEPFALPCGVDRPHAEAVAVDGDAVASLQSCGGKTVVHDFGAAEGDKRDYEYPAATLVRLAGPYLATAEGNREIVVREWRTGAERLRVPMSTYYLDVQSDGTIAFVASGNRVMVASPAAPEPRVVGENAAGAIRIARDRVAYNRLGGGMSVRALDGSIVADSPTAGVTDFDGERVAWVDRTCGRFAIATWDLQGSPPALPRANPCPIATLRSSVGRVSVGPFGSAPSVRVKLTCVAEPPVGCLGQVKLFAKDSRPKYGDRLVDMTDISAGGYRLAPGQSTTLQLGYGKNRVCIAGRNGIRPIVEISGPSLPDGSRRVKKRRLRVVGLEDAIAFCAK